MWPQLRLRLQTCAWCNALLGVAYGPELYIDTDLTCADAAHAILREVASGVAGWKAAFAAKRVSAGDIELLAQYIDGDTLRRQREESRPDRQYKPWEGPFG